MHDAFCIIATNCFTLLFILQWLVMRFGIFNIEVIRSAVQIAKQEGVLVSLDLASFEVQLWICLGLYVSVRIGPLLGLETLCCITLEWVTWKYA